MQITLKAARVNAGLSQAEAAKRIGISKGTLCNYEKGSSIPKMTMAKKIAETYKLAVDDIIFFQ